MSCGVAVRKLLKTLMFFDVFCCLSFEIMNLHHEFFGGFGNKRYDDWGGLYLLFGQIILPTRKTATIHHGSQPNTLVFGQL